MLNRRRTIIRPARLAEVPELSALIAAAIAPYRGVVHDRLLERYVSHSRDVAGRWDKSHVLVAEQACGGIAGTVTYVDAARKGEDGLPAGWAAMRSLMVHPDMRGRGYGQALVRHCIDAGRADGAVALGLHTAGFMRAAQRLYHMAGFSRSPAHDLMASRALGLEPGDGDVRLRAYRLDL